MRTITDKNSRIRVRQMQTARDETMTKDHRKSHHFVVYRLEDDVCALCRRPRAEHPRRGKK